MQQHYWVNVMIREFLPRSPGYSLRRASNAVTGELVGRLAALDIRLVDATVLLLIERNPQITASAIGRELDIQRANMVPLLKRLEDAGLVERTAIDGKSFGLGISAAGAGRVAQVRSTIEGFEAELLQRIPAEHREHIIPALDMLWR